MSPIALPKTRTARDAVLALLRVYQTNTFSVYDGEVEESPPADSEGRIHPMAVLWSGAGSPLTWRLCQTPDAKQYEFQVTAAGGNQQRCVAAVDTVMSALLGERLSIPDGTSTRIAVPLGFDPGPIQTDTAVNPQRRFIPLLFTCRLS